MKFGVAVTTSVTPAVTELEQKNYVELVSSAAAIIAGIFR